MLDYKFFGEQPKAKNDSRCAVPYILCQPLLGFIDGSDAEIFVGGGHPKAVNYKGLLSTPPRASARRFSLARWVDAGIFWWGGHPKAVNHQGLLSTPPSLCHCETVFDGSMLEFLVGGSSKSCKLPGSALFFRWVDAGIFGGGDIQTL